MNEYNEAKRQLNDRPLSDLITSFLKVYRLEDKMKEIDVLSKWEEMMGKAVALRTKSIYIKNKILYLEIESSVMRDELLNGKSIILQRVNQTAGFEIIKDIWFS